MTLCLRGRKNLYFLNEGSLLYGVLKRYSESRRKVKIEISDILLKDGDLEDLTQFIVANIRHLLEEVSQEETVGKKMKVLDVETRLYPFLPTHSLILQLQDIYDELTDCIEHSDEFSIYLIPVFTEVQRRIVDILKEANVMTIAEMQDSLTKENIIMARIGSGELMVELQVLEQHALVEIVDNNRIRSTKKFLAVSSGISNFKH